MILQYIVSFMGVLALITEIRAQNERPEHFFDWLDNEDLKVILRCFSIMNRIFAWQAQRLEIASAYKPPWRIDHGLSRCSPAQTAMISGRRR